LQVVALNWLLQRQNAAEVQTGETAFVSIAAALHGLHFVVAIWFLLFIVLQAHRDRYDHEYYWGVSVCAWFWHALGIIWLAVLGVIAFSSMPAEGPRPTWDRNVIRTLDR
jgi:cytochrome c oxidase subunit III